MKNLWHYIQEVRSAWDMDTSEDEEAWDGSRASTGQSRVSALVLKHFCGGKVLKGTYYHWRSNKNILHYWNVIDGVTVDITRDELPETAEIEHIRDATNDEFGVETNRKYELLLKRTGL